MAENKTFVMKSFHRHRRNPRRGRRRTRLMVRDSRHNDYMIIGVDSLKDYGCWEVIGSV